MTIKNGDAQRLGRLGGLARASKLTPERRMAIAKKAWLAAARKRKLLTP